jgi:hypothetical protein
MGKDFEGKSRRIIVVLSLQYPGNVDENKKALLRIHILLAEIRTENLPITSLDLSQYESSSLKKPQKLFGGISSTETSVHACKDTLCAEDGNSVPTKRVMPTCYIAG